MFILNRNYNNFYSHITYFAKLRCIESNFVENAFKFTSSFSAQQDHKILETLNESSPEELSKYKIPLAHIQKLINWKSKKGPFKNLSDVLEVEGFGGNILKEIAKCITYDKNNSQGVKAIKSKKQIKHLLAPHMSDNILSFLNTAVAIHLEPTGIGWARLERQTNTLTSWTYENFSSLPPKMMSVDTFNLALHVLQKTPPADVYIFESQNSLGPQASSKQTTMSTYNQKMELNSMLLALLNTSVIHNPSLQKLGSDAPLKEITNCVFSIKYNIPARLFGTLIGSEKVSAVTAINGLLNEDFRICDSLPYTPVIFEDNLRRTFFNQTPANKQLMGQALMLGVSFMDLCVRKTSVSYEALNSNKGRKKKTS